MKVNENDLFYICSLIESVSRKSGNSKADIVDTLGEKSFDVCIDLPISITVCQ